MAINETLVTGRKFRKLTDAATKTWQRISFWHKASDCEFNDGTTAETKVGAIKGITTDTNVTNAGYAADMTVVKEIKNDLKNIIVVQTFSGASVNVPHGAYGFVSGTVSFTVPSGYKAITVIPSSTNTGGCFFAQCTLSSNNTVYYTIHNATDAVTETVIPIVSILFLKI